MEVEPNDKRDIQYNKYALRDIKWKNGTRHTTHDSRHGKTVSRVS